MGFLDNTSITVDAVLTKQGRRILKEGGDLRITSFTLSDTGVDYTLWNPSHPSGSAFYGEAIENLPMLEASVHSEHNLRNRLVSLTQNTVSIPAIQISGLDSSKGNIITLEEGKSKVNVGIDLIGFTSSKSNNVNSTPYYLVVLDPTLINTNLKGMPISGQATVFLREQNISSARMYNINGSSFAIGAQQVDTKGRETSFYIVHEETGAYFEGRIINNVEKQPRNLVATNVRS